ncbi:hypothetical protein EH240_04390 [Mesorhizobium tamadayense]|uniref:Uncharacterized protein n=1 Tax=Mesorhizobium tamadayense TaxID=425306 RepID=A0A3P3G8U3_9HYPH|nr:hypothetical protein EH240_04390 [Mesorhizobium tamadayense]
MTFPVAYGAAAGRSSEEVGRRIIPYTALGLIAPPGSTATAASARCCANWRSNRAYPGLLEPAYLHAAS